MMKEAICQLCFGCLQCFMELVRSVNTGREFFDILDNVLFLETDIVCLAILSFSCNDDYDYD